MEENILVKYEKVLKKFVDQQKCNPKVIGIFVSGSFIHSKPDKNSDLDIFVLLDKSKYRERGNTWIDGIEIEYFINPVLQVKDYFKTEIGEKAPCTAHMFANSVVLYKKGNELDKLIKEAKLILKRPVPKMKKMEIELARYFIDDLYKDLEDTYVNGDLFAFNLMANKVLEKSLQIFIKYKNVRQEKIKRLMNQLEILDKSFYKLFSDVVLEIDTKKKFECLKKLVDYTEKMIGGKRPKEWVLKSKCTV